LGNQPAYSISSNLLRNENNLFKVRLSSTTSAFATKPNLKASTILVPDPVNRLAPGNWPCQYRKATGHLPVLHVILSATFCFVRLGVYNHQPKDVMEAVQTLRAKAKAAGNLKTTSQITGHHGERK
jgi:hypothetical protein